MNWQTNCRLAFAVLAVLWFQDVQAADRLFSISFSRNETLAAFGAVVRIHADGLPVNLLVDTGSAPTLMMSLPSKRRGLCQQGSTLQLAPSYSVRIPCSVIPAIPEFDEAHLTGMLSPQQLSVDALVVIDFVAGSLSGYAAVSDTGDLIKTMFADRTVTKLERVGSTLGAMMMKGALGTYPETIIDLDTGRPYTNFARGYLVGATFSGSAPTYSLSGKVSLNPEIDQPLPLRLGSLRIASVRVRAKDESGNAGGISYHGSIGRDLLKNCAIAIPPASISTRYFYLACQ